MASTKNYNLFVLKALQEHSDEHNPITQKQIIDYTLSTYGVQMERKAVASSILALQDEPYNYDINKTPEGKGFYLGVRDFEASDVLYLSTYLLSARNIPASFAKKISQTLQNNLSEHYRKNFHQIYWMDKIDRTPNKHLPYIIEDLSHAIRHNKQITFTYSEYKADGSLQERKDDKGEVKVYRGSPYYLINSHGTLYLLVIIKHKSGVKANDFTSFRIEFINNVKELNETRDKLDSISNIKNFNLGDFLNTHPYITGDNTPIEMKVEVLKPSTGIRYIKDWYGNSAKIEERNNKCYATMKASLEPAFWWIMQYSKHFKLIGPKELIKMTRDAAKNILDTYK